MNDTDLTDAPADDPPLTFESLGVSPHLVEVLASQGITEPFAIQRLSIADALAGRDVCGKAKTGSGKTLAFGIPLLQRITTAEPRRPKGLVLVPTRELALQVHDVLAPLAQAIGSRVVAVYGGADMNKQIQALADGVEAIIATPGRLIDLVKQGAVILDDVEFLVLDEADRMLDLGFVHDVRWIADRVPRPRQTLCFSATVSPAVRSLASTMQVDAQVVSVAPPAAVADHLEQQVMFVQKAHKLDLLMDL
ncbi:MAG: DEAD/DEAH box helicase, partial [Acidimicrobiales bacterium]|nr:DEAD/DEAH box helicase [Acidimicrobiales bacterium]